MSALYLICPGFISHPSHASDVEGCMALVILHNAWCFGVSGRTGWTSVSTDSVIAWVSKFDMLLQLSNAACQIVQAECSLRYVLSIVRTFKQLTIEQKKTRSSYCDRRTNQQEGVCFTHGYTFTSQDLCCKTACMENFEKLKMWKWFLK